MRAVRGAGMAALRPGVVAAAAALRAWCAAAVLFAAAAAATSAAQFQPAFQVTPGALIVQVKPDYTAAMDVHSSGLRYRRPFGQVPNAGVYDIVDGKHWRQKQKEMQRNPAIEFAEPDYRVSVQWLPNDALFGAQWHHAAIGSEGAWNSSRGHNEIKVCHLDSGVRTDHPDLVGRVLKGWNLVPEIQEFDQESALPGSPHYANINDTFGHGTHTAGIIAAVGNNGLGVAGMAPDVKLLVCKFIWDDGFGSISDALECLRLCREEGATVSSNSWGGVPHSKAIEAALVDMEQAGMLFVVASGNQGIDLDTRPAFPASSGMRNMVVVGSSGRTDGLSDFSNMGRRTVHLLSPGEGIMSTTHNGRYGPMDGTSMACPLVAGAAALLQSAALSRGVQLSYGETRQLLLATVDPLPKGSADATLTSGRLNIASAMQALAVVMKARGLEAPPGTTTEGPAAEELLQRLQASQWAAGLLPAAAQAPTGAVSAASMAAVAGVQPPPMGRKRSRRRLSQA